jgi:hypothetical protein
VRRWRSLIILGAAALVIGALWWWDQRTPRGDDKQLIPGLDQASVAAITLVRDGATIELQREGTAWKIDGLRADAAAIERLLGALDLGGIERSIGRDAALAKKVGLDPARLRVKIGRHQLAIGSDSPGTHGIYVARDGEILVVDRRLKDVVDLPPEKWRLVRPLLTDSGAIRTLELGDAKLERAGDKWTVNGALAEPRAVDQLLDAVDRARATALTRGPMTDGQPITINGVVEARVAGRCANGPRIARADGATLCFDDAALKPLFQTAKQLREPRLFPLSIDAITGVELREGEHQLTLHREAGAWRIVAPLEAAGPADDPSVRAWLEELLARTEEGGPQTLTVRTADSTLQHAVRDQPLDPLRFRDRRVIDVRPEDIDRLTIDGYRIVRERHGGDPDTYQIEPPVPVDDEALRTLIETFAQLRAETFDREKRPATRTIKAAGQELHLHGCAGELGGLSFTLDERTCHALQIELGR